MKFDLLIFDCDGVLVDSEPISNRIFTRALDELGFDWSYEQVCSRFIGLSMARCVELIERDLGRPVPERFLENLQRRTFEAFRREGLPAVGGVAEVLANLEIPFCVASSGEIEKMETTLGLTGLLPRFAGRMFSASQVPFGKPAPDLFLFTAGSLGVAPERCAVVEDSLPGVQAAVAAGMTAFGYVERSDARSLASAGAIVFDSMTDLPGLIERCPVRSEER